jgi:hypothetical protein
MDEPEKELAAAVGELSSSMNQALDAFKGAVEKFETKVSAQRNVIGPFVEHYSIPISIDKKTGMFVATALPSNGVKSYRAIAPNPYRAGRDLFRQLEQNKALER